MVAEGHVIPPNINFDRVTAVEIGHRREVEVTWFLEDREVKKLVVTEPDMLRTRGSLCRACLHWRGVLQEMTERAVLTFPHRPWETFTHAKCPACSGLDWGEHCYCGEAPHAEDCSFSPERWKAAEVKSAAYCVCGEVPHRVHCPLGFRKYFPMRGGGRA